MKNIIKIISLLLIVVTYSCDQTNENFNSDPTSGWVEFFGPATTTGQTSPSVSIPLDVRVPIYENGLNISYTISAAEGDFTQFVSASSGTAFADPADNTRNVSIDIPLMNMDAGRDFVTSFDITITSVDNGVRVGVDENSITTHRVTIPCSNPAVVGADFFVGDYAIADVAATIGPGNGTENFAAGTVTLAVDPTNPNRRIFSSAALPAFNAEIETVTIEFTTDNVVILGDVDPSLSCGGGIPYTFTGAAVADSSPWDICNDTFITVVYTEDPFGSCGGPYVSSFTLTAL
ncbi:hypothetical protein [Winogradskyella sp. 3972H.M.0a.05]|uniref:hypothetical protein n=1 Tax=Winogradskyella sp. 3972H.M.0a.05 TaxID=2950277 RepID=UPI003393BBD9